jgi:hypothetical protein
VGGAEPPAEVVQLSAEVQSGVEVEGLAQDVRASVVVVRL